MPKSKDMSLVHTGRQTSNRLLAFACTLLGLTLPAVLCYSGALAQNIEVIPPPPKPAAMDSHPAMQSLEESLEVAPPVNIMHTSILQILCSPDKYSEQVVNFRAYAELNSDVMRLYPTEELATANMEFDSIKSLPLRKDKITLLGLANLAECNNTRVRVTGKLVHSQGMQPADVQIDITQLSYF
ncbi:MAG: hypothetical protein IPP97_26985 [Candidatus Obscuribacter sp.]|nr:hypothetical protein [Candidatus Obscuribacter sp.]MBP6351462.1 hypothetical protein [Candidatus Obscuribacter sp.]MBP6594968.1 hypothetical protein [Candidatus Obscuribacter sp.]MBP7576570.1 hypothetical protein [Candidatus Obscuribacter sp.]